MAGDGTYQWGEKIHGKNLLNQKRAKNYKPRKNDKGLEMPNPPTRGLRAYNV